MFIRRTLFSVLFLLHVPQARTVSPYLFGENLWNGDTPGEGANRVWSYMKQAGFRIIRVGGIAYNEKTPSVDQYVRWVDSIKSIGAEPLIQVSSIESVDKAASLVTELNVKRGYKIRFWAIGNEPTCGRSADAAIVADLAGKIKARASAMKAVDPAIRIFIGDECYWRPELYDGLIGGDQDVTGKDGAGRYYVDAVAFHSYPFPGSDKNALFTRKQVLEQGIPGIRGMFRDCASRAAVADAKQGRTGANALACALTEFNVTYWNSSDNSVGGVGVSSFLNGQFFAEIFGAGMEYGAFAVLPWSMLESGGDGSGDDLGLFGFSGTDSPVTGTVLPRPAYQHIRMMAGSMKGEFLPSAAAGGLKVFATRDGDSGAVLILNESESVGVRFTLRLGPAPSPEVAGDAGTLLAVDAGWPVALTDSIPAQATLLLKVSKTGAAAARQLYTLTMAKNGEGPSAGNVPVALAAPRAHAGLAASWTARFRVGGLEGELGGILAYEAALIDLRGRVLARTRGVGDRWRLDFPGMLLPESGVLALRIRAGSESRLMRRVSLRP